MPFDARGTGPKLENAGPPGSNAHGLADIALPISRTSAFLVDAARSLNRRGCTYVRYYNYHRLSGTLGWLTPAERYDGTPFTDLGFQNIPALAHLQPWLEQLQAVG